MMGLEKRGYQFVGRPVAGDDERFALPGGDEFIEVDGLGRVQLAHGEVVEYEDVKAHEFVEALVPGAVSVAAGEAGQDSARLWC